MNKLKQLFCEYNITIFLIASFFIMFILSSFTNEVFLLFGTTSIDYLKKQYYRWLTCIFLHASIGHVVFNSIGLIAISSLIKFYITNWKLLIIFLLGGCWNRNVVIFCINKSNSKLWWRCIGWNLFFKWCVFNFMFT